MKRLCFILAVIFMIALLPPVAQAASVNVSIDGDYVKFSSSTGYPFVSNGRTYVPLRATMEAFGAEVEWESSSNTAIVRKDNITVRCVVGEKRIFRNNTVVNNDAKAVIVSGRTYLPIRVVAEAFGATVTWDGNVRIKSKGASLINKIENTPAVDNNFWNIWNTAVDHKNSGKYKQALDEMLSVSSAFLKENNARNCAIMYSHIGDCYVALGDYDNACTCYERECYYWKKTTGMNECLVDAQKRAKLMRSGAKIYVKTTHSSMGSRYDFGAPLEPKGGIYLGAYAEGDYNVYDPYDPNRFYMDTFPMLVGKDMAAYLLYLPYGKDISFYESHVRRAIEKDKILQISLEPLDGLKAVNNTDGYLKNLAKAMEASECRFILRFAGEMNDTSNTHWYHKDPSLFIEKFRLVADVFHKYAPSVPIIWAPNFHPEDTYANYYPGDKYVDYVGVSSYMNERPESDPFGERKDRNRWSSQLDTLYSLYGHKKPIIIVEGGASYINYDTYADITSYSTYQLKDFYTYLPIKYPNVKMSFIFGANTERRKFALSTNYKYLKAYQEGINTSLYLSTPNSQSYNYSYYELCNGATVRAEKTLLAGYVSTPVNDVAYSFYYINGVKSGVLYDIPYKCEIDFSKYKSQKVTVEMKAFDSSHKQVAHTTYTVNVQ